MQHCDAESLSLLALGEDVPVDREHLRSCPDCSAEYAALRSVVSTARRGPVDDLLVPPPASVWAGIAAATGVTAVPASLAPASRTPTADAPATRAPARSGRAAGRGGRWPTWALVAAAVAGVLGGAGVVEAFRTADRAPEAATISAAVLEPLAAPAETGRADVVETGGQRVLRLETVGLPADADGFYEVWLLDAQAQKMVPLGVLRGDGGEYVVPAGLDLGEYPVVDVSVEPLDGDPTHSGNSLLRGTLGT